MRNRRPYYQKTTIKNRYTFQYLCLRNQHIFIFQGFKSTRRSARHSGCRNSSAALRSSILIFPKIRFYEIWRRHPKPPPEQTQREISKIKTKKLFRTITALVSLYHRTKNKTRCTVVLVVRNNKTAESNL